MRFSASVPETRTVFKPSGDGVSVTWAQDDTIGIWSSNTTRGNFPYVAGVTKTDATKAQFSVVSEDKMFLYDGTSCTYYAYWPYDPAQNEVTPELRFSLPALQRQAAAGDVSHLSGLSIFRADPVTVSGSSAQADFVFRPALSNIHFALAMDAGQTLSVPIRKVRLVSADAPLSAASASIDLKTAGSVPVVGEGATDVTLSFETMPALVTGSNADAYLAVVPGKHQAALTAEITAVDGSVASYSLPAVEFVPGKIYSREIKVKETDFVQAEPFDISASSLSIAAGQTVDFSISGAASEIEFWSGEKFHDYAYASTDRIDYEKIYMTFLQALLAGGQGDCLKVKLSTDFNGTKTETAILSSTWTDITDAFNLDTEIMGTGNPNSATNYYKFKKAADVAVSDYAAGKPFRVVLFWHALPDKGGRTVSWVTGLKVWNADGVLMNQDESKGTNPFIIEGASYGTDSNHCGWFDIPAGLGTSNCLRFFSTFTLTGTAERHAYAVIDNSFQSKQTNLGPDKPAAVQKPGEDTPSAYSYTFEQPGTYNVVFVSTVMALDGSSTKVNKSFTITVS